MKHCTTYVTWQLLCMCASAYMFVCSCVWFTQHRQRCDSALRCVCTPSGISPAQSWHFNACLRDCAKDWCFLIKVYFLVSFNLPFQNLFSFISPFFSLLCSAVNTSHLSQRSCLWLSSFGNIIYLDLNLCGLSPLQTLTCCKANQEPHWSLVATDAYDSSSL